MLAKKGKKIKVVMVNGKPQVKIVGINDEPEAVKESDNKFAQKLKARGYIKRGQNERERVKQITKYLEKDANKDFKGAYPSPWVNRLQIPGHGPAQDWWMDTMNSVKRVLGEGVNEVDTPMYKITYQDSTGRKKTDIMRAKNSNLAKRDFSASNKGRGFKILKVVKEGTTQKFKSAVIDKAVKIAKSMGGNMTAAVKKIEKIEKNLSKNGRVEYALQQANEGLGDRMSKKLKKHKGVNLKKKKSKLKLKLKGRGVYQKYDGLDDSIHFESITENGMTTNHIYYEEDGKGYGYTLEFVNDLNEAEYQGRKVKLGKIMQGDAKKFKVYVKNPKGNVVKVNFGQGGDAKGGTMKIRKSNPGARKSFRARHNCDNPGPRHKARYWSCRKW
jgi:hypothetical protein